MQIKRLWYQPPTSSRDLAPRARALVRAKEGPLRQVSTERRGTRDGPRGRVAWTTWMVDRARPAGAGRGANDRGRNPSRLRATSQPTERAPRGSGGETLHRRA